MIPVRDRITCTVRDACEESRLGKTKFYELIKSGRVATVKIDGRRLVRVDSLLDLLSPTHKFTHKKDAEAGEPTRTDANQTTRPRA